MTDVPLPPHSLESLRAEHLALLKAWPEVGTQKVGVERATALSEFACLLGEKLDDPVDRDAAQGIVDYWTAALASVPGQAFPELRRLLPFNPDYPAEVVSRARRAYEGMDLAGQAAARELLVVLNRGGPEREPADERARETRRRLLEAGVLAVTSGGGMEIADKNILAQHWPDLAFWIARDAKEELEVEQLRQAARLWEYHDRQPVNLLSGAALAEARSYLPRAPEVAEFVTASERSRLRRRLLLGTYALTFAGVVVVSGLLLVWAWGEVGVAQTQRNDANTARVNAVTALAESETVGQTNLEQLISVESLPAEIKQEQARGTTPGRVGYIWAGNAARPLLRDENGAEVQPSTLRQDGRYVARSAIMLRAGYPSESYASAPQIGVIEPGATVRVLDPPHVVTRASGAQYWIRIEQVILLTMNVPSAARGEGLVNGLREAGYEPSFASDAQSAARVAVAPSGSAVEVRFYRPSDALHAQRLVPSLSQLLGIPRDRIAVVELADIGAKPGAIDLSINWQALGGSNAARSAGAGAAAPSSANR